LVLALGAHNIFEGMAFGLMETIEQAGQLAAGILIHMSAEAISLGGAFARSGYKTKEIIVLLLVFSVITPIGTIIGM
jgi:zinc transporter ZupT